MGQPRSIIFYAWALFAAQLALAAGVIAVVLLGGAQQRANVIDLNARAQAAQLANLTMVDEFLSAQRTVRAYQATGDLRLLREYLTGKIRFYGSLGRLRRLAGAGAAGWPCRRASPSGLSTPTTGRPWPPRPATARPPRSTLPLRSCPAGSSPRTASCGRAWPGTVTFSPRRAAAPWTSAGAG